MKELKERFGGRLSVTRGARGEERFQTDDTPGQHAELARECLQAFTPWSTACSIPPKLDPLVEEIHALTFDGSDPDQEHAIEVNRFHATLHPDCFTRLAASLNFAPPAERLATPYFAMSKDRNQDQDRKPPPRSRRAPQLDEAELDTIKNLLAERSSRRKTAAAGLLRIIVDGSERARLDLNQASRVRFEAHENDELIEVRSADGLLLATHLLNHGESPETERPMQSSIVLERGQRLSFAVAPARDAAGEMAGATIDLSYRETRLSRAAALHLRRLSFAAGNLWRQPGGASWRPALAFAALMIIALGLMLYWRGQERTQRKEVVITTESPQKTGAPAPPSPAPAVSPTRPEDQELKKRTAPAPQTRPSDSLAQSTPPSRAPQPNDPELRQDTGLDVDGIRSETLTFDGVALLAVKKVHVDPFGSDALSQQFRDQLAAALRTNRRLTVTANRDDADAVLKGKMTTTRAEQVSATVRLVNADGKVIWPVKGSVIGKQYQGAIATVASQIVKDLLADIEKAERK